jgi:hypothetical protein
MRVKRFQNRVLQILYRPAAVRILPSRTMASLDALDKAIEKKITPLLTGLFR